MKAKVRMRSDLKPRCDRHDGAFMGLEPIQGRDPEHRVKGHIYRCPIPSCTRAFHGDAGYFDVVSGKLLVDGAVDEVRCPEHETAMYLANVTVTRKGRTETWRCSEECKNKIERTGDQRKHKAAGGKIRKFEKGLK